MSIYLRQDVFVEIKQLEGEHAPQPLPLHNGFAEGKAYEVLGVHTASESAEAYLILRNDRDEMWFISNRHCRIVGERRQPPVRVSTNGVGARGLQRTR